MHGGQATAAVGPMSVPDHSFAQCLARNSAIDPNQLSCFPSGNPFQAHLEKCVAGRSPRSSSTEPSSRVPARSQSLLPPSDVGDRCRLLRVGHVRIAANHLDLALHEGARGSAILPALGHPAREGVTHVDNRGVGRFVRLLHCGRRRGGHACGFPSHFRDPADQLFTTKA